MGGQLDALKLERERHVLGDRPERVAQIDAEIAALKHPVPEPEPLETAEDTTPLETAVVPRPARRKK